MAGFSMNSSFRRGSFDITPALGERGAISRIRTTTGRGSSCSLQVSASTRKKAAAKGGDR